jgi:hypothetical protein
MDLFIYIYPLGGLCACMKWVCMELYVYCIPEQEDPEVYLE